MAARPVPYIGQTGWGGNSANVIRSSLHNNGANSRHTWGNSPVSLRKSVTTPIPSPPSSSPLTTPSPLETYHLRDYPWVLSLKQPDSNTIIVTANNQTTHLDLSRDADAPRQAGGDAECARATDGAAGVCVYLTRCAAARSISVADYSDTFCSVNTKYAGVCCPRDKVDVTH